VAAPLARIGLLRLQTIPFGVALALWAFVTLTKSHVEQVFKASLIGGELLEELANVCLFHAIYIANALPYVKGIHPRVWRLGPEVSRPLTMKALMSF